MPNHEQYDITISTSNCHCPICGTKIFRGDACLRDDNGRKFCLKELPARRLIPKREYEKRFESEILTGN